jgi:hypothetical protein
MDKKSDKMGLISNQNIQWMKLTVVNTLLPKQQALEQLITPFSL